ncbi:PP2C family protein-serine/threonine phosphatase [Saccharothrix violaceirubra]|uniref:Serine phosphatase RsbU (Regulator of sigma subunit) n=1 Tax=Saccharothrix violaceirubra TaxID=413306 RepID=A0A7W7T464_9PSEU|nr:PP2C family protein-serine/threonine phosphatase [Saccharothrix violaceirubra]MBB4966011.1 serine phosphatase RsbU (regulator of sigma subunit) [Saccharothrix violaceirubra]
MDIERSGVPQAAVGRGWRHAPYPSLVLDREGQIRAANESAHTLIPRLADGVLTAVDWVGHAHEKFARGVRFDAPVSGSVGTRSFEAHPVGHDDGSVTWWLVEDTDARLAREALRLERDRVALLGDVSSVLLTSLNPERCMMITASLAAEHLADAAVVVGIGSARRDVPTTRCVRGGTPESRRFDVDVDAVVGLGEAMRGYPPVPSRWIDPAGAPAWLVPDGFGPVGSMVITPLPGHGVPAGALVLLRRVGGPAFSEDEEAFARLFAARAGTATSSARLFSQQATITETLLRDLLPPTLRRVDGVEYAGRYRPSPDTERVGGDFYDVHALPAAGGRAEVLAVVGDVSGKGLEAAVLTGKIRTTLQALLPLADDHQRVIDLLNGALRSAHHTRFATFVLASVSRIGRHVRLRLTSAGHLPPLIVRADGEVRSVPTTGTLVGVLPEVPCTSVDVALAPDDTCLLYTDGIVEARGGALGDGVFGEDRLRRALASCAGMPADAVAEHVHLVAEQWSGANGHDDMALLAITSPRGGHPSDEPGRHT